MDTLAEIDGLYQRFLGCLNCADFVAIIATDCLWRKRAAADADWTNTRMVLSVGYRFCAPACLTPAQLCCRLDGFLQQCIMGNDGTTERRLLVFPKTPGYEGIRGRVFDPCPCPGAARILELSWRCLLRHPEWITRTVSDLSQEYALVAYPERWARDRNLGAVLALEAEVDYGPTELTMQLRAFGFADDGSVLLFSHIVALRPTSDGAPSHAGCVLAGLSTGVIEEHCRKHPTALPKDIADLCRRKRLFQEPIQDKGKYEWVRWREHSELQRTLEEILAAVQ